MAQTGFTPIQIYYSTTSGEVPLAADMIVGELALNVADKLLFTKDGSGLVVGISGGATGGGGDQVFVQNSTNVTVSYTLPTGKNAESVGPISILSGVTVTIPSGQRWVVL
jgi:hypothetical protein